MRNILRTSATRSGSNGCTETSSDWEMLAEEVFTEQLDCERRRAARSGRRFVLMLLDPSGLIGGWPRDQAAARIVSALAHVIRETDITGWYTESVIGVIFSEIGTADGTDVANALRSKINAALCRGLGIEDNAIDITFHTHPGDWGDGRPVAPTGLRAHPDLMDETEGRSVPYAVKIPVEVSGGASGGVRNARSETRRE